MPYSGQKVTGFEISLRLDKAARVGGNDVARKNKMIETGIIELDILIELFHKRVLNGRILSWRLCFRKPLKTLSSYILILSSNN